MEDSLKLGSKFDEHIQTSMSFFMPDTLCWVRIFLRLLTS